MTSLAQDLKYAFRTLRSSPGFTAIAIATIAIAIGANAAMFSFVDGALLNPVPYPDADRIVELTERLPDGDRSNVAALNFVDWVDQSTVFESMAAESFWGATLTGVDEPVRVPAARVSAQYFRVSSTSPEIGRDFQPHEEEVGNDKVVLLSHRIWENRFGSDAGIVGREIVLNGEAHVVIGVLPKDSSFDRGMAQIWKPLAFTPSESNRDFHWLNVRAKLRAGIALDQAQVEMNVIAGRISDAYPNSNQDWGIGVQRLADTIVGSRLRAAVTVLFGATVLVLLIGCANLASLSLARGISRGREMGIRSSLGAGRLRLARQVLTENLLLSLCGGLTGIAIAYGGIEWARVLLPPSALPQEVDIRIDTSVMLFALAAAGVTGLLFGLAPALQASHTDLKGAMKDGGHGSTAGAPSQRIRSGLVVGQVSLAFMLLFAAGLLLRSLFNLIETDPGFDSSNVLTAGIPVTQEQYQGPDVLNAYLNSIQAAVEAVPGVRESAITTALPLQGWGFGMPYQIADREFVDRGDRGWGFFKMVSPSYFGSLRIPLRSGRALRDSDTASSPRSMVINEAFAQQEFANENPIGQRIVVEQIVPGQPALGSELDWEVVGVVSNEHVNGLNNDDSPGMYVPIEQSPNYNVSLIVRSDIEPRSLQLPIRKAVESVNKDQVMSDVRTLEQIEEQSIVSSRAQSTLLVVFAAIALLLAALGIYGTISYTVVQRTHEIGIRAALGASLSDIRGFVFRGGMRLTSLGLVIGLLGSLALAGGLNAILYDVSQRDPATLLIVTVLLFTVAAGACFIPAWRAARIDPMHALRRQ